MRGEEFKGDWAWMEFVRRANDAILQNKLALRGDYEGREVRESERANGLFFAAFAAFVVTLFLQGGMRWWVLVGISVLASVGGIGKAGADDALCFALTGLISLLCRCAADHFGTDFQGGLELVNTAQIGRIFKGGWGQVVP